MRFVCDASPLIVLAKAGCVELLPRLADAVEVPQAVIEEIVAGPVNDPMRKQIRSLSWLSVVHLPAPVTPVATWQLGLGETEVIEWTRCRPDRTAVIDDHAGRRAAKMLGLHLTGTLGIIALAARKGFVPSFTETVDQLRNAGLYVSPSLVTVVSRKLGC